MTWRPPARSPEARQLHAAAEEDRRVRPERYLLGPDAIDPVVAQALRRGADEADLGPADEWRPGLEQYLTSAESDARLDALGARNAHDTAVGRLRARARIARHLREHPEVADRPLDPPIVIVGGWRTGTTFLFRLLATDPRLRAPLPAELAAPWSMAQGSTAQLDPAEREARIDASAAAHDLLHLLNPDLAAIHDSGARLAEECVLAMGTTMRNWGFLSTTRLEGYARWLADQDLAEEYAQHRRILQILDGQAPPDGTAGRRWVLKAPAHTAELDHLAATYPGACVVHLHRDIVETVASGASLFATFRSTYSDHVDSADVGRYLADQTELWLRRALAFRDAPAARTVTLVDVAYTDLVADPAATLARIYAAAALDPPDVAGMVERFHESQPRHARGTHRYTPEDFGLAPDALRERMAFAAALENPNRP